MKKIKFLIIGDLPLATQVFRILYNNSKVKIVAVFTQFTYKTFNNDPWDDKTSLYEEALKYNLPIFHDQKELVKNYSSNYFDFGISCRASVIYKPQFLKLFKKYLINMHGGLLPARAGLYISCHCIIEGDKISGGTLHIINEKIDNGDILARDEFPILSNDTSFSVYQKTQLSLLKIFKENINMIIENKIKPVPQQYYISKGEERKYYNKKSLENLKQINLGNITSEELYRRVRGLDFPGHEPAYIIINGQKIYLTTREFFKNE